MLKEGTVTLVGTMEAVMIEETKADEAVVVERAKVEGAACG